MAVFDREGFRRSRRAHRSGAVSRDGAVFTWKAKQLSEQGDSDDDDEEEETPQVASTSVDQQHLVVAHTRWGIHERHYFHQTGTKVVCTTFHRASNLLIAGFSNGVFGLWELPAFTNVHTLSISQEKISSVAVNATGEWLAFGAKKLGQLLVWEWQSESYVLKQQGHFFDMNTLAYSPDAQYVVAHHRGEECHGAVYAQPARHRAGGHPGREQ